MKLFLILVSLFAAAQAQFTIRAPAPGTTLQADEAVTIQVVVPVDTSAEAGQEEISLVIGMVGCGSSACPAPSADLGQLLYVGRFQPQGEIPTLNNFANYTFVVPTNLSGPVAIQAQHVYVTTPPGHAIPTVEYQSVKVEVQASG